MADEFTFSEGVRERVSMLIGLGGPSGSGKTLSALKIARGLVGDDNKIFAIDTEEGRMLHYACAPGEAPGPFKFKFRYTKLGAPFTQERYAAAVTAAEKAGAGVIIIDSMSHSHEGVGGLLEQHEMQLTKMAGTDYGKREAMKFAAWIEPKRKNNKLVNSLLQRRPHIIFCFRAKDKMAMTKNARGKNEPTHVGWTAICSDRFEYEMTMLLMLPPNSKGVPDLDQPNNKINQDHRPFLKPGNAIDEKLGMLLAAWAAGGAPASPRAAAAETETPHDPETGEIKDDIFPPHEPPQPSAEEVKKVEEWSNNKIAQFDTVTEASFIDDWLAAQATIDTLARARAINPDAAMAVVEAAHARKLKIEQEKFTDGR